VAAGATEAVMEMSSHALDQERVWGIPVDVGIFTNLTQDHLDYHGTMRAYYEAKRKLFHGVGAPRPRVAVINVDDWWGVDRLIWDYVGPSLRWEDLLGYGIFNNNPDANTAQNMELEAGRTTYLWRTRSGDIQVTSPLTGRVNVYNLLAASCAALARGLTLEEIAMAARNLTQVPGRFQVVPGSAEAGFTVVVDYAHTDDALHNLISLARELVAAGGGRVITVFGCGGDRDRTKRPKMGRVAAVGSDLVVVTSDNPRSEDPMSIIDEALVGVRETTTECIVEPGRAAAIGIAIRAARPGDIVLLAGKGHEKIQIFRDQTVPFDDVAVAAEVLKELQ
jgi:UDP-N-acetylmuramoyl-L-alanyl-D-glutamate--2,6-diaminopimelate ligase